MSLNLGGAQLLNNEIESFSNQFPVFLNKATLASSLKFGTLTANDNIVVPPERSDSGTSDVRPGTSKPTISIQSFATPISKSTTSASPTAAKRKLILLEDLPNIFTSSLTRTTFRSALLSYAQSKRVSSSSIMVNANVPLVIIVSETLTRPGQNEGELAANRYQGSGEVSVSVRSVVPPDVVRAPGSVEYRYGAVSRR